MCNYPEMFKHNVEKEFNADDIFEKAAKIKGKLKKLKNAGGAAGLTEMMAKNKVDPAPAPEAADETQDKPLVQAEKAEDATLAAEV